jgi:hypothetical protein
MKPVECQFEPEVLAAVFQSRWPGHVDAPLRLHVAACPICSDLVAVAGAFDGARDQLVATAALPDPTRVWHLAQLRARREAVQAAGRPITAAQVLAFAAAMGLLGACFGATSTWFQSLLARVASSLTAAPLAEHSAFVLGIVAAVLLLPTAVFVALGRD